MTMFKKRKGWVKKGLTLLYKKVLILYITDTINYYIF